MALHVEPIVRKVTIYDKTYEYVTVAKPTKGSYEYDISSLTEQQVCAFIVLSFTADAASKELGVNKPIVERLRYRILEGTYNYPGKVHGMGDRHFLPIFRSKVESLRARTPPSITYTGGQLRTGTLASRRKCEIRLKEVYMSVNKLAYACIPADAKPGDLILVTFPEHLRNKDDVARFWLLSFNSPPKECKTLLADDYERLYQATVKGVRIDSHDALKRTQSALKRGLGALSGGSARLKEHRSFRGHPVRVTDRQLYDLCASSAHYLRICQRLLGFIPKLTFEDTTLLVYTARGISSCGGSAAMFMHQLQSCCPALREMLFAQEISPGIDPCAINPLDLPLPQLKTAEVTLRVATWNMENLGKSAHVSEAAAHGAGAVDERAKLKNVTFISHILLSVDADIWVFTEIRNVEALQKAFLLCGGEHWVVTPSENIAVNSHSVKEYVCLAYDSRKVTLNAETTGLVTAEDKDKEAKEKVLNRHSFRWGFTYDNLFSSAITGIHNAYKINEEDGVKAAEACMKSVSPHPPVAELELLCGDFNHSLEGVNLRGFTQTLTGANTMVLANDHFDHILHRSKSDILDVEVTHAACFPFDAILPGTAARYAASNHRPVFQDFKVTRRA